MHGFVLKIGQSSGTTVIFSGEKCENRRHTGMYLLKKAVMTDVCALLKVVVAASGILGYVARGYQHWYRLELLPSCTVPNL